MLVLPSKSNANITIHPIIANLFLMLPFQLEGKNSPKKEKGRILNFSDFAIVLNTLFYVGGCDIVGHPPDPQYLVPAHLCVVVACDEVVMVSPS